MFLRSTYSNSPRYAFEQIQFQYALTLIHELAHNAQTDASRLGRVYEHIEMDAAAIKLGSTDFDHLLRAPSNANAHGGF